MKAKLIPLFVFLVVLISSAYADCDEIIYTFTTSSAGGYGVTGGGRWMTATQFFNDSNDYEIRKVGLDLGKNAISGILYIELWEGDSGSPNNYIADIGNIDVDLVAEQATPEWVNFTLPVPHVLPINTYWYTVLNGSLTSGDAVQTSDGAGADCDAKLWVTDGSSSSWLAAIDPRCQNVVMYGCISLGDTAPPLISNVTLLSTVTGREDENVSLTDTPTIYMDVQDDGTVKKVRCGNDSTMGFDNATDTRNGTFVSGNNWTNTLASSDKLTNYGVPQPIYCWALDDNGNNHTVWNNTINITLIEQKPPEFSAITDNSSTDTTNSTNVQINITITDLTNIDFYTLTHNDTLTGNWTNETIINIEVKNITVVWNYSIKNFPPVGGILGVRFWANDTNGFSNVSNIHTITIQETPDIISPSFSNNQTNATSITPKINDVLQLNITVADDRDIDNVTLATNQSGTLTNVTTLGYEGTLTSVISVFNLSITMSKGLMMWQIWANDSSGNSNVSQQFTVEIRNSAPVISSPYLNATDHPLNRTTANLTCTNTTQNDADSDTLSNSYKWWINNQSRTVLDMSFDTNEGVTTKDFSSYGNNGTVIGATWNITGGINGSPAYEFDGVDDYIELPASNEILTQNDTWTFGGWFKANSIGSGTGANRIVTLHRGSVAGSGTTLELGHSNELQFFYHDGDTTDIRIVSTGTWYHVMATYDGTNFNVYVNSILNFTVTDSFTGFGSFPAKIGSYNGLTGMFDGTIDEVQIFNTTLSAEQIHAMYLDGKYQSTLVSDETEELDNIICQITTSDGEAYVQANSSTMRIADETEPSWSLNQTNATMIAINGNVTFNITVTDAGGLNYYIFSWNGTGVWDNITRGSISGTSQKLIVNKSTTLSRDNTIGYRWYANDTSNNMNMSILRTFIVYPLYPPKLDILFNNETSSTYKTTFGEGEDVNISLNWTDGNGDVFTDDDGDCNVTLYNATMEYDAENDTFTLCSNGCNYTSYREEIDLQYTAGARKDFIHFYGCHEQTASGIIIATISCGATSYQGTVAPAQLPLCSVGKSFVMVNTTDCISSLTVNITLAFSGPNSQRKNISGLALDREYSVHNQVGDVVYEPVSELWVVNHTHEYYEHGTKVIGGQCGSNISSIFNNNTNETITVVNTPPFVSIEQVNTSGGLTNLTDDVIVYYFGGRWDWFITVSDDDLVTHNVTWYNSSGTQIVSHQSIDIHLTHNTSDGIFFERNNPYNITVWAIDTKGAVTNLTLTFNVSLPVGHVLGNFSISHDYFPDDWTYYSHIQFDLLGDGSYNKLFLSLQDDDGTIATQKVEKFSLTPNTWRTVNISFVNTSKWTYSGGDDVLNVSNMNKTHFVISYNGTEDSVISIDEIKIYNYTVPVDIFANCVHNYSSAVETTTSSKYMCNISSLGYDTVFLWIDYNAPIWGVDWDLDISAVKSG